MEYEDLNLNYNNDLNKIPYPSPSGLVNIGKYIPPFEKVENGYGFMGLMIEDSETGQLQCHLCGNWYESFYHHLKHTHKINNKQYKEKFGLSQSTALVSKRVRLKMSEVMIRLNKENPNCFNRSHTGGFQKGNQYSSNRKGKNKSLEAKNKIGVCDLQIMDKVIKLSQKLNKTPSLIDLKNEYGYSFVSLIHSRYSSYVSYCKNIGLLPLISNNNPKYSKEYFINKFMDNQPSHRLLTSAESRRLYQYFPKGINELKEEINKIKLQNIN